MDSSGLKLGQVTGVNKPKLFHKDTCNFLNVRGILTNLL